MKVNRVSSRCLGSDITSSVHLQISFIYYKEDLLVLDCLSFPQFSGKIVSPMFFLIVDVDLGELVQDGRPAKDQTLLSDQPSSGRSRSLSCLHSC